MLLAVATPSLLAGAESPGLGSTTTAAPNAGAPTTAPGDSFVLPAGFTYLVDDTNRITVAVPTTWTDISTAPTTVERCPRAVDQRGDGLGRLGPDVRRPRRAVRRLPVHGRPADVDRSVGALQRMRSPTPSSPTPTASSPARGPSGPSAGATGQAAWHLIVASPADQAFTAAVVVQLSGPQDQQALEVVLETFNVTPSATWPASAPGPSTTLPGSTIPATTTAPPSTATVTTVPVPPPPVTSSTLPSTRHVVDASVVDASADHGGADHSAGSDDDRAAGDRYPTRRRDELPDGHRAGGLDRPEPRQQPARRRQ